MALNRSFSGSLSELLGTIHLQGEWLRGRSGVGGAPTAMGEYLFVLVSRESSGHKMVQDSAFKDRNPLSAKSQREQGEAATQLVESFT